MSFERIFEDEMMLIAVSSSRILPSEDESTSIILSSMSFNCLEFSAPYRTAPRFMKNCIGPECEVMC